MKQRGRKSADELTVASPVVVEERPEAPVELTLEQAYVWAAVVGRMPADSVRGRDVSAPVPVLPAYGGG